MLEKEQVIRLKLLIHRFETDQSQTASQLFSADNIRHIENLIVHAVDEKVHMEPNHLNPGEFFQRQEYLRGQIDILKYLIACSQAVSPFFTIDE